MINATSQHLGAVTAWGSNSPHSILALTHQERGREEISHVSNCRALSLEHRHNC